jgi:hypothetical protein
MLLWPGGEFADGVIPQQQPWRGARAQTRMAGDLTLYEISTSSTSDRPGLVLTWTELPRGTLVVSDVRKFGPSNEIYAKAVPGDALAAINGGFFGYNGTGNHLPLGLVVANGRRRNRLMPWRSGGVLVANDDGAIQVVPIRRFSAFMPMSGAVQSKPLLVENGAVAVRGQDPRFNRSAVALTDHGTLVLAGAFESFGRALSLKEFATFLVDLHAFDNIRIDVALAMDGGPGAHLYFPPLAKHYGDPGSNYVPNLVYLKGFRK